MGPVSVSEWATRMETGDSLADDFNRRFKLEESFELSSPPQPTRRAPDPPGSGGDENERNNVNIRFSPGRMNMKKGQRRRARPVPPRCDPPLPPPSSPLGAKVHPEMCPMMSSKVAPVSPPFSFSPGIPVKKITKKKVVKKVLKKQEEPAIFHMGVNSSSTGKKKKKKARNLASEFMEEGRLLLSQERFEEARVKLDQICRWEDAVAEAFYLRSTAFWKTGRYQQAIMDCERCLDLDPSCVRARLRGARILKEYGLFDTSETWLANVRKSVDNIDKIEEALRGVVEAKRLYKKCCKMLLETPGCCQVQDMLRDLVEMCPTSPGVLMLLVVVDIVQRGGEGEEVKKMFNNWLKFTGFVPEVRKNIESMSHVLGKLIRRVHQCGFFDNAFELLTVFSDVFSDPCGDIGKACAREKVFLDGLNSAKAAANRMFNRGHYSQAVHRYMEALRLDPKNDAFNSILLLNRAAAYMGLGNHEYAVSDCTLSLKKNPGNAKAYSRRARANIQLRKYKTVLADFETAFRILPSESLRKEIDAFKAHQKASKEAAQQKAKAAQQKAAQARKRKAWKKQTYYQLLGVTQQATRVEIRKAFHKKALIYHPDKAGADDEDASEMFKLVAEAYETLREPRKKREYDMKQRFSSYYY